MNASVLSVLVSRDGQVCFAYGKTAGAAPKEGCSDRFCGRNPLAASIRYGRLPNGRTFHQGQVVTAPDCGGFPEA